MSIPDGYEAQILPSPRAAKIGLIATAEPLCSDRVVARDFPGITIMLQVCKTGGIQYSPRDYINIGRGEVLALLKITKKR